MPLCKPDPPADPSLTLRLTKMVMEQFIAMPEVSEDLKKRMQLIIDADMAQVAGKVQKS